MTLVLLSMFLVSQILKSIISITSGAVFSVKFFGELLVEVLQIRRW